jgi:O-antigen ligase
MPQEPSRASSRQALALGAVAAALAVAAPALVLVGASPKPTLMTDLLALGGWGLFIALVAVRSSTRRQVPIASAGLQALFLLLGGMVVIALGSAALAGGPPRVVLRDVGVLLAACAVLAAGARLMQPASPGGLEHIHLINTLLLAFVCAGCLNAAVAITQYLVPGATWAPLNVEGRAVGHLRQPNHLATQLLWAYAALVALHEIRRLPIWLFAALATLLLAALAMSASRTGVLACIALASWGVLDRRLSAASRLALIGAPVLLVVGWWALAAGAPAVGQTFGGTALLNKADPTSSRWGLWQQTLRLIEQNAWFGVGWGQFNFAWTLTPMEPIARSGGHTFSHAHNLFLHWAAELGVPLALLASALLGFALWRAVQLARQASGIEAPLRSGALAMLGVVLVHSLLEFPLWHANFLLPAAFLFGLALGQGARPATAARTFLGAPPTLAGALMVLAAAVTLHAYQPISHLYHPPEDGATEQARIDRARQSPVFGHYGDRFAGTLAAPGERTLEPYQEIVFEHLDLQLLMSWSQAYAEAGQFAHAHHLAMRLKEFRQPATQRFFEVCDTPLGLNAYQCRQPPADLGFRDFR